MAAPAIMTNLSKRVEPLEDTCAERAEKFLLFEGITQSTQNREIIIDELVGAMPDKIGSLSSHRSGTITAHIDPYFGSSDDRLTLRFFYRYESSLDTHTFGKSGEADSQPIPASAELELSTFNEIKSYEVSIDQVTEWLKFCAPRL